MRITEIRCTYPVRKDGVTGSEAENFPLKRGTTVFHFDSLNAGLEPALLVQSALCSRSPALSDSEKKNYFQAFYHEHLSSLPDSFEKKIAAVAAVPEFSFIVNDGVSQKLLPALDVNKEDDYLLRGSAGAEANLLGQRLDWVTLLDDSVDAVTQRSHLFQLRERLELSREQLAAPAQGKLYRTRSDLIAILKEPALNIDVSSVKNSEVEDVRSLERRVQELKEKDDNLREEQRILRLLAIKNDYEKLLKLRRELEELESNTTYYARAITGKGRDITVHELTVLSSLFQEYQEREEKVVAQREEVEKARQLRLEWEQERILAEYKLKQLQKELAEVEDLEGTKLPAQRERDDVASAHKTNPSAKEEIGLKHFLLLGAMVLVFVGLLLFNSSRSVAIFALVLAGIGLVGSAYLFLRPRASLQTQLNEVLTETLRSPERHPDYSFLSRQFSEQKELWQTAKSEAERVASHVNRSQIALHSLEDSQQKTGHELLRQLSRYAEIDDLSDADHVLTALRNQRQTVTSYDEAVSEFLRQIADVRKGRTDEDMMSEYEKACAELYGDLLTADDVSDSQNLNVRSQALKFDENRARRIEIERVDLGQSLSRLKQQLQQAKSNLEGKEEILTQVPALKRRRDYLEQNLWQEINDIELFDLAISMLEHLYELWRDLPLKRVRNLTVEYSRRLQGLKMLDPEVNDYMVEEQRGIRRGELDRFKSAKTREKELALIDNSPSDIVYLAFRMALIDSSSKDQAPPLFIFDLPFLSSFSRVSEFLNLLEERMLGLSAQSVLFTSNNLLIDAAAERQIPIHEISCS